MGGSRQCFERDILNCHVSLSLSLFPVSSIDVRQPFCDHDHIKMEEAWVLSLMTLLDGLPQTSCSQVHLNLHETWLVWISIILLTEVGSAQTQG